MWASESWPIGNRRLGRLVYVYNAERYRGLWAGNMKGLGRVTIKLEDRVRQD